MPTLDVTDHELQAIRAALEWTNSSYFEQDDETGSPHTTALQKVYKALGMKPRSRRRHS